MTKQRLQMAEVLKCNDYVFNTLRSFMSSKQEILNNIRERLSKFALKVVNESIFGGYKS